MHSARFSFLARLCSTKRVRSFTEPNADRGKKNVPSNRHVLTPAFRRQTYFPDIFLCISPPRPLKSKRYNRSPANSAHLDQHSGRSENKHSPSSTIGSHFSGRMSILGLLRRPSSLESTPGHSKPTPPHAGVVHHSAFIIADPRRLLSQVPQEAHSSRTSTSLKTQFPRSVKSFVKLSSENLHVP